MTYGKYSGNPVTEWLIEGSNGDENNRDMQLCADFSYEDPDRTLWKAPKGSIVNGASIPRPLWSLVGSPYTGAYRRASIVHDIACSPGSAVARADADRMFYFACLCGGCSLLEAKLLYAGVRIGAWSQKQVPKEKLTARSLLFRLPGEKSAAEYAILGKYAAISLTLKSLRDDATLDEIEAVIASHLDAEVA